MFRKTKKRNNMSKSPEDKSSEGCIIDNPQYEWKGKLIWIRGKMLFVNVIFFLYTLKSSFTIVGPTRVPRGQRNGNHFYSILCIQLKCFNSTSSMLFSMYLRLICIPICKSELYFFIKWTSHISVDNLFQTFQIYNL